LHGGATYSTTEFRDGVSSLASANDASYAEAPLVTTATDNVTLSVWVKWNGGTGEQLILYIGHSGYNGYGMMLHTGNNMRITLIYGGIRFSNSGVALNVRQWTHLAAVRRKGTWELWVNGLSVAISNSSTTPVIPSPSVAIGFNFNGWVDNARIYERALSVNELEVLAAN